MVKEAKTKIHQVGSRHTVYLPKGLVEDSAFPFKSMEPLIVRIDGERLIVEKDAKREKSIKKGYKYKEGLMYRGKNDTKRCFGDYEGDGDLQG